MLGFVFAGNGVNKLNDTVIQVLRQTRAYISRSVDSWEFLTLLQKVDPELNPSRRIQIAKENPQLTIMVNLCMYNWL